MAVNLDDTITHDSGWRDFEGDQKYLCIFAHYDRDTLVADYLVPFMQNLRESGCDIVFVSNSDGLSGAQIGKISPYVNQVIVRKNVGYDFAAYFTGYQATRERLDNYKRLLFVNDSVYGPFFPIKKTLSAMFARKPDLAGMTDAYAGKRHMQSYFWGFTINKNVKAILDDELQRFEIINNKAQVVGRYEEGISQRFMNEKLRVRPYCSNKRMVAFESEAEHNDPLVDEIRDDIRRSVRRRKIGIGKRIAALFSQDAVQHNREIVRMHANDTGIYSHWYTALVHFDCPFVKVSLLKNRKTQAYHKNRVIGLLKDRYPDYNTALIENHLERMTS